MNLPSISKANRLLKLFGWTKIPLIAICNPRIIELSASKTVIRLPLNFFTKNHLKSMYFGALAVGADLAGGLHAFMLAQENGLKLSLAFKNFKADFHSRPTSAVYFVFENGPQVEQLLATAKATGERITEPVFIKAFVNYPENPLLVAQFELGLSIKIKQ